MTESELADYICKHLPQNDTPLRLNSCSDLESAKLFSKEFPNRDVYATNAIVNIHPDGGITTVARSGNDTQQWRKLKNGEDVGNAPTPEPPVGQGNIDKYLQLGFLPDKYLQNILTRNPNLATSVTDAKNKIGAAFGTIDLPETVTVWGERFAKLPSSPNGTTTIENILETILEKPLFAQEIKFNPSIVLDWHKLRMQAPGVDVKRLSNIIKDGEVIVLDVDYNTMTELLLPPNNAPMSIALTKKGANSPASYTVYKDGQKFALDRKIYQPTLTNLPSGGVLSGIVYDVNFLKATRDNSSTSFASCTMASLDIALRANGKTPLLPNDFNIFAQLNDQKTGKDIVGTFKEKLDNYLGNTPYKEFEIQGGEGHPTKALSASINKALGENLQNGASYIIATAGTEGHAFNAIIRDSKMYILDSKAKDGGHVGARAFEINKPAEFIDELKGYTGRYCKYSQTYTVRIYNVTNL